MKTGGVRWCQVGGGLVVNADIREERIGKCWQ